MAVVRTAYRALARHIKCYEAQGIPLTGVVDLPAATIDLASLSPVQALQRAFRSPLVTLDGELSMKCVVRNAKETQSGRRHAFSVDLSYT